MNLEVSAPLKEQFVRNQGMSRMLCILLSQRHHATATEGNFHPTVDNGLHWHQRERTPTSIAAEHFAFRKRNGTRII